MPRSPKLPSVEPAAPEADAQPTPPVVIAANPATVGPLGSLADLPVAGLTRRRIAILIGALVAAWVIVLFARQVSEASDASARADVMRTQNEEMAATVQALEDEYTLIQKQAYIEQQAREYRLGTPRELPFILADDAPVLPPDAPGTAATRLGATLDDATPLDSWLTLLFGPADDPAAAMNRPIPSEPPTPEPSF